MGKRLSIFFIDEKGHRKTIHLKGWQVYGFRLLMFLVLLVVLASIIYFAFSARIASRMLALEMENRQLKEQLMVLDTIKQEVEELRLVKKQLYDILGLDKIPSRPDNITAPPEMILEKDLITQTDTPYGLPVSGVLTRGHGNGHIGIDLALKTGSPVFSTGRGVVMSVDSSARFGLHVWIRHAKGYRTLYAHLSRAIVSPGDSVRRGQVIGYSGSSGESTGPHIHYEVWKGDSALNPLDFME